MEQNNLRNAAMNEKPSIEYAKNADTFQKSWNYLKILGARRATRRSTLRACNKLTFEHRCYWHFLLGACGPANFYM